MDDGATTAGRLLVATPALGDPNFERTVVLMLEHGDEGALGLVLNRPTPLEVASALPDWAHVVAPPPVVFIGGPVSQGSVIALAQIRGVALDSQVWAPIAGLAGLGVIDISKDPADTGVTVEYVRMFTGYAGWGPGQLEGEIEEGAWYVVDALPSDALRPDSENLWRLVLRRQGGSLARVALFPPDLSVN